MQREPTWGYIFRVTTGFAIFLLMCMLYWSSTLVEEKLFQMSADIQQIKRELDTQQISNRPLAAHPEKKEMQEVALSEKNLLTVDSFYKDTLPRLLGEGFVPWGKQRLASIGKPDNLHPFSQWREVSSWIDRCTVSLARSKVGKYETLSPEMAISIEEVENPTTHLKEFIIRLREDVFWEPLKASFFPEGMPLAEQFLKRNQVTAHDYKLWFDAIKNPFLEVPGVVSLRTYYGDVEEVRVIDPMTFAVRWKAYDVKGEDGTVHKEIKYGAKQLTGGFKPLASFVYKYFSNGKKIVPDDQDPNTYATNTVWAQNFTEHWAKNIIVSCGPWIFDGMSEREIKFIRNPRFYDPLAALTEKIVVTFKESTDNIWQAFKSGELTMTTVRPDLLLEYSKFIQSDLYQNQVKEGRAVQRLDYTDRAYAYIGWNSARAFFNNKRLRLAMTMAIDRKRIIKKNLNDLGVQTTGTIYRYSPNYNKSIKPWPFNPEEARKILEEEGWTDSDGNGILDKTIDGVKVPFSFTLTYFVKNPTSKSICEYIATALKNIGIDCKLNGLDMADLSSAFDDKNFDALCMMWSLGSPPEEMRQLWSSAGAKEKGSSNMVGFANSEADKIIDALDFERSPEKRKKLYDRFSEILHEEQPYTFLFTPKTILVYREELQNVFLPIDRQDLIPGADVASPVSSLFWLKKNEKQKSGNNGE